MPYRSYPNADRARRQLDRHHVPQPVPQFVNASMAAALAGLAEMAKAIKASAWRPDAIYDPSTDRLERWPAA